jgi:hypothetical protein
MANHLTATFKAYIGTDRDLLLSRLISLPGWSHIGGQPVASAELNHVEIKACFTKNSERVKNAIRSATLLVRRWGRLTTTRKQPQENDQ